MGTNEHCHLDGFVHYRFGNGKNAISAMANLLANVYPVDDAI
jgi:hypothetical protein